MSKIKILFFASSPQKMSQSDLQIEAREIDEKIHYAEFSHSLEFIPRLAVRSSDVLKALNEVQPHIVHFSGHGRTDGIILLDKDDQPILVKVDVFKDLFITMKDNVQIVFFNNCYSEENAISVSKVIDCVVGMNTLAEDKSAIVFAASFYSAIGSGRSVQDAFDQGKVELKLEGLPGSATPVLKHRDEVNPSSVFPLSFASIPFSMPDSLKALIKAGSPFFNVPMPQDNLHVSTPDDDIYLQLKLKTGKILVVRVSKLMKVGDAAEYLTSQIKPEDVYDWTIQQDDKTFDRDYLFRDILINTGKVVSLYGDPKKNHIEPLILLSLRSKLND
jgi:hypothetical protein